MSPSGEIRDVTDTALWVASYRADESARPDALFKDPYAARLAGERGPEIARAMGKVHSRRVQWTVVIRTVMIDQFIMDAIASGIDTVLNLGAGMDARPYRMKLPPTLQWIEADFAPMIDLKESKLAGEMPVCRLERVRVDLADSARRREFLAQAAARSKKILVLTEGVTPYLSVEEVAALARDLRTHPSYRLWIVDYISPFMYDVITRSQFRQRLKNAPFQFKPADWWAFYRANGWRKNRIRYTAELAFELGRGLPTPRWTWPLFALIPRSRALKYTQGTGFAMLEPTEESE